MKTQYNCEIATVRPCAIYLLLYNRLQIALWCWLSLFVKGVALSFGFSLITNVFKWMCMIKNLLKLASKGKPNIS